MSTTTHRCKEETYREETAAVGLDETTATKSFRARGILGFILLREYHMGEPGVVAGTARLRDVCGGL